jgi:hypothetical protein
MGLARQARRATGHVTAALALAPDSHVAAAVIACGAVWQASQKQSPASPVWSEWGSLGRPGDGMANALALHDNADAGLKIFARALRGDVHQGLWHRWQAAPGKDDWSDWFSLGMPVDRHSPGVPVVGRSADGPLELFTVATDGAVWHRWQQTNSCLDSWAPC